MSSGCAIIIGVSYMPGLGHAIAKRFAEGGLSVGIIGRNAERLKAVQEDIEASTKDCKGVQFCTADVTDRASLQAAIKSFAELGEPTVLVYNPSAPPFPPAEVADLDPERLVNDFKTGPVGFLTAVQAVMPAMKAAGKGTILVTGATASLRAAKGLSSFASAKTSLRALSQSLAKEVSAGGIHVAHVIVDGLVDMPIHSGAPNTAPMHD
mmetsp:Transcript_14961/g.31724  ORF Transcript_14961/g.31724 Transcript_14961/m.31724 type:complete len:209 (+) Transcript_14961:91-717(+)